MGERGHRILSAVAVALVLGWVGWSFYDGFVRGRTSEGIALEAAHKAFEDGRYDDARAGYRDLLDDEGVRLEARRGLARTLMEQGRLEAAQRHFDRAIEAAPEYGASYANRGILHDRMGRHRRALADYRRALELDPSLDDGPGWMTRFMRNQPQPPPTIGDRAAYLARQLSRPPGERRLRSPEEDAKQESYRVER